MPTLGEMLAGHAEHRPDAVALAAPGRPTLSYDALHAQTRVLGDQLRSKGIGPDDRVAIVLPNGPQMASLFMAVASVATAAPLNPRYRAPELDFYLEDLKARALIVMDGDDTPAVQVAESRGIDVIRLRVAPGAPAGAIELDVDHLEDAAVPPPPTAQSVCLVLHTSGTTARPKIVPLAQANVLASAAHITETLGLGEDDLCMNIMPLFHIHGLMAATLSSLYAGGTLACTDGFVATEFFDHFAELRPTWYTAVPTMHQAILARAADHAETIAQGRLRLIRSSSSSLPPSVAEGLEAAFSVPVIESYGMTEAAHQMCSNALPPGTRKLGGVGPAAGPEVAIMDEAGALLPAGTIGEVVIRGPNVTQGYANNPEANAKAFTDGWFRTGDQGRFDEDGHLFLTGRLKELILRGGENIAPREIDEVLLRHPDVKQAVAFALPDERLGEDVAAAVVLEAGGQADESSLRRFAAETLADYKVPRRIVIVDEVPKGATGKLQRIGLAEKLGLLNPGGGPGEVVYEAPATDVEQTLADIWQDVLRVDRVGRNHDFFALGGDSILAAQVMLRCEEKLNAQVQMLTFFEAPTLRAMAAALGEAGEDDLSDLLDDLEDMTEEEAQAVLSKTGA